jgi:hypothetical protein
MRVLLSSLKSIVKELCINPPSSLTAVIGVVIKRTVGKIYAQG